MGANIETRPAGKRDEFMTRGFGTPFAIGFCAKRLRFRRVRVAYVVDELPFACVKFLPAKSLERCRHDQLATTVRARVR